MREVLIAEYDYELPDERIAQHPVAERDMSKLLISASGRISQDIFRNIDEYLPSDSLLVFNNTKVIRARILFRKSTGAAIEVLCLEPLSPSEYQLSFSSTGPVEWKCIVGNLKKWKNCELSVPFYYSENKYLLKAAKIAPESEAWRIRFRWDNTSISFGEVLESIGHIPLPPYIDREDIEEDSIRYQTVYSSIKGSVAAPTAGLHFTTEVFESLKSKGIETSEITLHVGAGTFQPVKSESISDHKMHCEHFTVDSETLEKLIRYSGKIIPVGTTSVRTLESIYWLGVKLMQNPASIKKSITLNQWEAYDLDQSVSLTESLEALLKYIRNTRSGLLSASTSILIIPGYKFRMISGLITNFHQPRSTLLLLISAFTGEKWKEIYRFALENEFRFLSYGDSSLLLD